MPYLSFDFDLLERLPEMARAASVEAKDLCYGCLLMWRYCWRERTEHVGPVHLDGFFGCRTPALVDALAEFGVVEREADDRLRVKGADRYKRILEARQKGAGAANAKRRSSAQGASRERDVSDAQATQERRSSDAGATHTTRSSVDPAALTDGLTASSEQRAANSREGEGPACALEESTRAAGQQPLAPAPEDQPAPGVRVLVHRDGAVREVGPTGPSLASRVELTYRKAWEQKQRQPAHPRPQDAARAAAWATESGIGFDALEPVIVELARRAKGLGLLPSMFDELRVALGGAGARASGYTNDVWKGRKGGEVKL